MKLTSKKVEVTTRQINTSISREMIEDLKAFRGMYDNTGFYVLKSICENVIFDNNLISVKHFNEDYNEISINEKYFKRIKKLYKITKEDSLKKVIDNIDYIISKKVSSVDMMESELVNELSKSIDREIIKNLMKLK